MISQGNEILTLGFGHYSCHLATNFFNIQEASFSFNPNFSSGISHDVSFRENSKRSNLYTPRVILIDDKNYLGYLSEDGYYKEHKDTLNEEESDPSVMLNGPKWEKNNFVFDLIKEKQRIKDDAGPCHDFLLKSSYNLDDGVKSWSDYVVTEFDEHSIITIPKHTEFYENYENFLSFDSGLSLWQSTNLCGDIEEKVRFFLEESDNLQGFQILTDGDNGYSGLSSACVEYLKDEYSKKALLSVPVIYYDLKSNEDIKIRYKKKCDRIYSLASSFAVYSEHCDIVAPMSHLYNPWGKDPIARLFRNIKYKEDMMYHTSAILASAFDLLTLPYRLQNPTMSMNTLSSSLNIYGRNFTTVGINMPFPVKKNEKGFPSLEQMEGRFFESLTPMIDVNPNYIDIQSVTSKGLGRNYIDFTNKIDAVNIPLVENDFKEYIHQQFPRVITKLSSCKSVFRVPRTFPKVLNSNYNLKEVNYDFGPLSEYITVGGLHNSKEMQKVLSNLYGEAKIIKKKSIAGFRARDSDIDYEGLFEGLKIATQSYEESSFL